MKTWVIYAAIHTSSGSTYVGQTSRTFTKRKEEHLRDAGSRRQKLFHATLNKYGADSFEWKILCEGIESFDEACRIEVEWILKLNAHVSQGGLNLTFGGEGSTGFKHTLESRKKIGEAHKGKPKSADQRKKMGAAISAARKGKKYGSRHLSNESRERMRQAQLGRPHKGGWHHSEVSLTKLRMKRSTYICKTCGEQGHSSKRHRKENTNVETSGT